MKLFARLVRGDDTLLRPECTYSRCFKVLANGPNLLDQRFEAFPMFTRILWNRASGHPVTVVMEVCQLEP